MRSTRPTAPASGAAGGQPSSSGRPKKPLSRVRQRHTAPGEGVETADACRASTGRTSSANRGQDQGRERAPLGLLLAGSLMDGTRSPLASAPRQCTCARGRRQSVPACCPVGVMTFSEVCTTRSSRRRRPRACPRSPRWSGSSTRLRTTATASSAPAAVPPDCPPRAQSQ